MRNTIRLAALAAVLAATGAQAATTANGTATAEILTTLTVAPTRSLDFGQIAANGAGTVAIASNGNVTCSALLVCTGAPTSAAFDVAGTAGVAYAATITTPSVSLSDGGTNTMTLDGFSIGYPFGTTLAAGASAFEVGGTLHVGATQVAGAYSGSFTVPVSHTAQLNAHRGRVRDTRARPSCVWAGRATGYG